MNPIRFLSRRGRVGAAKDKVDPSRLKVARFGVVGFMVAFFISLPVSATAAESTYYSAGLWPNVTKLSAWMSVKGGKATIYTARGTHYIQTLDTGWGVKYSNSSTGSIVAMTHLTVPVGQSRCF